MMLGLKYEKSFCENSTIHGIKYLSSTKSRTLLEKVWWFVCLLVSFSLCGYLIARINQKRQESPVIVSFNEVPIPVWQIPFPAITVCPETKARYNLFRFADTFLKITNNDSAKKFTGQELEYFNTMVQLCETRDSPTDIPVQKSFDNSKSLEIIHKLALIFDETFLKCFFRNVGQECHNTFSPIITSAGLCYMFNGLPGREIYRTSELSDDFPLYEPINETTDWNIDGGYTTRNLKTYPKRGFVAGVKAGLFTILELDTKDFDYICGGTFQGFEIILHNPGEHPHSSEERHHIQLGMETTIQIHPKMTTTSSNLRNYSPEQRGCFFSYERYLKFFQIYTKSNCEIECTTNYTLSKCGCVKFHMPRNKTTPICGANDIACYNSADNDILKNEIVDEMEKSLSDLEKDRTCNCLPVCNSIEYDADLTDVVFSWKEYLKAYRMPMKNDTQLAKINVYFKKTKFVANKRAELYSNIDFLANCGGLIGMFMGASLLSFIEILYFCLLRFIVYFKEVPANKKQKHNKRTIAVAPLTINGK